MAKSILIITHGETSLTLRNQWNFNSSNRESNLVSLMNWFGGVRNGSRHNITVESRMGETAATQVITSTGAATATDTITINGVVFTAVSSSPTANQFILNADPDIQSNNIRDAINASVSAGVVNVTATAEGVGSPADNVVTLTCDVPGTIGNAMTVSEAMTNVTVGGANFTGGASDLDVTWSA